MKILLVGENFRGTAVESIYNNLIKLGVETEILNTHDFFKISFVNRVLNKFLKIPHYFGSGVQKVNKIVLERALVARFDFILFIKPVLIYPETISKIKKYSKIIGYFMDYSAILKTFSDYFYSSIPLFDSYFFASPDNIEIMKKYGVKRFRVLPMPADTSCHYIVNNPTNKGLSANIVFLGTYAEGEKRVEYMERLCKEGYDVKIYGNSWNKLPWNSCLRRKNKIIPGGTPCEEMAKVINSSKITMAFMREKINEPVACRTFEIPLCGGFMLHQKTKEAEDFLIPDKEAVFFGSYEEMKEKIDFYLQHPELRNKIAKAGREKVLNCGKLNNDQVKKLIEILKNEFSK